MIIPAASFEERAIVRARHFLPWNLQGAVQKAGDRVLLICFNRLLGEWFANERRVTATGLKVKAE